MILGDDLNFSLSASNIWRNATQVGSLSKNFIQNPKRVGILDIEPSKLTPTLDKLKNKRPKLQND
jgi:hypothetical protein